MSIKTLLKSKISIEDKIYTLDKKGLRNNKPEVIVLHSTNYPKFDDLLRLHRMKGWAGVGYHLFVSDSRKIYQARPFSLEGAHALGFNTGSIGICFYSPDGNPNKKNVRAVKQLIKKTKEEYKDLKIISHTQAQISYINRLLSGFGIKKQFPETSDLVNKKMFSEIKSEIDSLIGSLDITQYDKLKDSLKKFKNCPGEAFNYFI